MEGKAIPGIQSHEQIWHHESGARKDPDRIFGGGAFTWVSFLYQTQFYYIHPRPPHVNTYSFNWVGYARNSPHGTPFTPEGKRRYKRPLGEEFGPCLPLPLTSATSDRQFSNPLPGLASAHALPVS
jgi:hypothetical protein